MADLLGRGATLVLQVIVFAAFVTVFWVGGAFYRTSCPSGATWDFNLLPYVVSVDDAGKRACVRETATSYYAGKVPLVGDPLRSVVRSLTPQP